MPKPRKGGGGGGWGMQSLVNGWINVNEHQLAPEDIHELQRSGGGGGGGHHHAQGNPPLRPPGAAAIAAAAAANKSYNNAGGGSAGAGRQQQHPAARQRGSSMYGHGGHVPGGGQVILGRRESAGSSSKWGQPVPLSPEASPMMGSGGSSQSRHGRQPPHLGLDASSASRSSASHSNSHSQQSLSAGGSSYGNSHSHGGLYAVGGAPEGGNRKSSLKSHLTSATTEGEMSSSDGHQSASNFSDADRSGVGIGGGSGSASASMSLLSSSYRRHSGQQYDGPVPLASVGHVLGSPSASAAAAAAAAPSAAALAAHAASTAALHPTGNFASSAANNAGIYGKTRSSRSSSAAYQSSELDYSTSAAGGSMQFGTSPYLNSRRASAPTELTVSTIPSRRDSGSPPEEEQRYHQLQLQQQQHLQRGGGRRSSSGSTSGSATSRTTTESRRKERNALRRTNSQSDILKVMAGGGGGTGQVHLSLEEKSRRKSDAFLRKVHEMQVQQRQKLIAVQEAEELRLHHLEDDGRLQQQQEQQLHQYPTAGGRSDRSLSVSGSGTSGSVTVAHSNTAISVNTKGTGSTDNAQVEVPAGPAGGPSADDASEGSSIQKFVSGILGMGGSEEKGKQAQQHQHASASSDKQQQKQPIQPVQMQQQQRGPTNTGQYLNEAAFMQQQQQKQSSSSVAGSSSGRSKRSSKGGNRRRSDDGLPLNTVTAVPSTAPENQRGLYPGQQPPLHPPQQQQGYGGQSSHPHPVPSGPTGTGRGGYVVTGPGVVQPISPRPQSQHGHGSDSRSCAQCTVMEKQLMALQADLDYLRSIIVQNEFICADCEAPSSSKSPSKRRSSAVAAPSSGASVGSTKSKKSISTSTSRKSKKNKFGSSAQLSQLSGDPDKPHESDALNDASQRLTAVASRHKRQIEHMTKETARWQNDMHLKLSKMSMMCKDLNDESAKRKEEATNIQATLAKVRADRNALESEVESLRARIALYEKEDVENDRVSQALDDKETAELDRMDNAIEDRDGALSKMSSHLDRALVSLEAERKEQNESQQAPANSSRKKSTSFNPASASETSFFNPLLGIARAARVDEGRAEHEALAETTRKEDGLQKRCNALEKQLEEAQQKLRAVANA